MWHHFLCVPFLLPYHLLFVWLCLQRLFPISKTICTQGLVHRKLCPVLPNVGSHLQNPCQDDSSYKWRRRCWDFRESPGSGLRERKVCVGSGLHRANSRMVVGVQYIHGVVREAGLGRWISWAVMQPHRSFTQSCGGALELALSWRVVPSWGKGARLLHCCISMINQAASGHWGAALDWAAVFSLGYHSAGSAVTQQHLAVCTPNSCGNEWFHCKGVMSSSDCWELVTVVRLGQSPHSA